MKPLRNPVVELRSAVVLLGRFPALAGVDLAVESGEVVLLRGPNGAGKSTLLRACAGLLTVSDGEARVLGVDLKTDRTAVRPLVGFLAHDSHLYDELPVGENLHFWARAAGHDDVDPADALRLVGLSQRLLDVPVQLLSAGQRRRVALAVVVARRPRLWLLDEPHAGLDAEGRDVLDDLMRRAAAAGATVLFASHELERAAGVATRTVSMAGGGIDDGVRAGEPVRAP
jgi:heme ABC exporter ATP-binding subunit CcmA